MTTIIGLASGLAVLTLLVVLHCVYSVKRESVFPIAEIEKFNEN